MKIDRTRLAAIPAYAVLFVISLIIPLMHILGADAGLNRFRCPPGGLLPGPWLEIKWLGQLARLLATGVLLLTILSPFAPVLRSPRTVTAVSVLLLLFATFYVAYILFFVVIMGII